MKVLQLGKFYPIRGGVEKVMWDLTEGFAEKGVACDMLCCMLPGDCADNKDIPLYRQEGDAACFRFSDDNRVICVPAIAKKAATMLSPAMIRWMRKHAGEYDIVHVHHPDPMAALSLKLSGFKGKVVIHWHSDIVSQRAFLRLYQPLQSWLIRRADAIIGTTPVYLEASPWLKDVQEKCHAVPIGIHPISASDGKVESIRKKYEGKKLVLSIGRLVPYKGFSYLLEAMTQLKDEFCLVIGGMGPLREGLQRQIDENGLGERVKLEGYLPDDEIPAWFQAADVFVLSSVMKTEAFGIVQIEAMSCGTPVVATRIAGSGVAWVNKDGVSGLNVTPKDSRELAEAIRKVCYDRTLYSDGARLLFQERYRFEKMIASVEEIYRGL